MIFPTEEVGTGGLVANEAALSSSEAFCENIWDALIMIYGVGLSYTGAKIYEKRHKNAKLTTTILVLLVTYFPY